MKVERETKATEGAAKPRRLRKLGDLELVQDSKRRYLHDVTGANNVGFHSIGDHNHGINNNGSGSIGR